LGFACWTVLDMRVVDVSAPSAADQTILQLKTETCMTIGTINMKELRYNSLEEFTREHH
jgi:hypothetical protein